MRSLRGGLSQRAKVDALVQAALDGFGKVAILVNNAGIISTSPLMELTECQWDRTVEVHLKGTSTVPRQWPST